MFFFIGGVQPRTVIVDKQPRTCPECGHSRLYLKRIDQYVSLFFIPLLPIKRGIPFLACENCNSVLDEQGFRVGTNQHRRENKCTYCGGRVESDFSFCPYCGRSV